MSSRGKQVEVTLPSALTVIVEGTDALAEVAVARGRSGSLRLRGTVDAIRGVHLRLWAVEEEGSGTEKAAYRRWRRALAEHGIPT